MQKVYYLGTCDTCKRILKEIDVPASFELQEIKEHKITPNQIEQMQALSVSYEALFSKRARMYKERDLKNQQLTEADFKSLILEHYTFLKRPVIINNDNIFIGNSKKTIEAARANIHDI